MKHIKGRNLRLERALQGEANRAVGAGPAVKCASRGHFKGLRHPRLYKLRHPQVEMNNIPVYVGCNNVFEGTVGNRVVTMHR